MATHDFSLRPFHLGTLIGVRSFKISGDKLLGPVYPEEFAPGQNVAKCGRLENKLRELARGQDAIYSGATYHLPAGIKLGRVSIVYSGGGSTVARRPLPANAKMGLERLLSHFVVSSVEGDGLGDDSKTLTIPPPKGMQKIEPKLLQERIEGVELTPEEIEQARAEHVATRGCTCGFYAYFDRGHNPHHLDGNIIGLIEGYGVVTVGERGFRAQKARLLCLVDPQPELVHLDLDGSTRPSVERKRRLNDELITRYNVPVFKSLDLALAEYPLTPPDEDEDD